MELEKFKEYLREEKNIDKDQANTLANAAIVLLTILTEKYNLDPVSEREPAVQTIKMLQCFVELPM